MKEELTRTRELLANRLFERGAIKFGTFELKSHEKNPEIPLSPIYINLQRPPGGPLTNEDIKVIGRELYALALRNGVRFHLVADIPQADEPFAEEISRLSGKPLLKFNSRTEGYRQRIHSIINGEYRPGQRVLLVDDLINHSDTVRETIRACLKNGLIVAAVVVLIDEEQGGLEELKKAGYNLYAAFPISALLNYYVEVNLLTLERCNEVMAYFALNA